MGTVVNVLGVTPALHDQVPDMYPVSEERLDGCIWTVRNVPSLIFRSKVPLVKALVVVTTVMSEMRECPVESVIAVFWYVNGSTAATAPTLVCSVSVPPHCERVMVCNARPKFV